MRVLFLTHRLPYAPDRGDRIRSHHMLRALAGRAEVDVVSFVHDAAEAARVADLDGIAASVTAVRVPRLRNLIRALPALATARPLTHVLLDAPAMRPHLERIVRDRPPDVVFAYCSGMARLALEAPLAGRPLVVDFVDVDSEKWAALARVTRAPKRWIYAREARVLRRFEQRAVREAYATMVVNEREHALLERLAPGSGGMVVPNGIDISYFRPTAPPAVEPHAVFCGVFSYAPNAEAAAWLIREVWPEVRARRADARLTIVGAAPPASLRAAAARDPSIEVTGTVPDVRPYLWRASVGVAPLATARGVQNKVLEALAAGLPSVVTPAVMDGLPPEVHAGCAVADTPHAFRDALLTLFSLPAAERAQRASSARLETLGWSERLGGLEAILQAAAHRVPRLPAAAQPAALPAPAASVSS